MFVGLSGEVDIFDKACTELSSFVRSKQAVWNIAVCDELWV